MRILLPALITTLVAIPFLASPGEAQQTIQSPHSVCSKTRTVIRQFPYVIGTSGSYVLGKGLAASGTGGVAITISADNVALDLNGYTLAGGAPGTSGILCGAHTGVQIRNGTLRGWPLDGVQVTAGATDLVIEGLLLQGNGGDGLNAPVSGIRVERVRATNNGATGIRVGDRAQVTGCAVAGNADAAIRAGADARLSQCSVSTTAGSAYVLGDRSVLADSSALAAAPGLADVVDLAAYGRLSDVAVHIEIGNARNGVVTSGPRAWIERCQVVNGNTSFTFGSSATVVDCVATEPEQFGYIANGAFKIRGSVAEGTGAVGFAATAESTMENCDALDCRDGFAMVGTATVRNCNARTTVSMGAPTRGFDIHGAATVEGCTTDNFRRGFYFNPGSSGSVLNCQTSNCESTGFLTNGDVTLRDSLAIRCADGFSLGGEQGRVIGCEAFSNTRYGFLVFGPKNVVMSCYSHDNTVAAYSIASGNDVAPISPVSGFHRRIV